VLLTALSNIRLQTDAAIGYFSSSFPPVQVESIRAARLNRGVKQREEPAPYDQEHRLLP
jgi:hypothetical protein